MRESYDKVIGGRDLLLKDLLLMEEVTYLSGNGTVEIDSLAIDSTKVTKGALFICIRGAEADGHSFIDEAIRNGACAILVEKGGKERQEDLKNGEGLMKHATCSVVAAQVADTRSALAHISAIWYGYPARELTLIGITGTKGKTTSSYLIKSILENAGRKVGLIGTNEVIIGRQHFPAENTTPDALTLHRILRDMIAAGLDTAVMEVSSQAIKRKRTEGILFDFGIFTNLSPDHIAPAEHKDFREYLECKRQLFRQCKVGIINGDDFYAGEVTRGHTCEIETYGLGENCMLRARNISLYRQSGKLGAEFEVAGAMDFGVKVPLPGKFSVYNALAAVSICRHFAVRESDIQRSMLAAKVKGRIEVIPDTKDLTVIIDYAHNAAALESLLTTLREYRPKKLICLFGCGGNRPALRRKQMGKISGSLADLTIVTDDNPRYEDPAGIRKEIEEGIRETEGEYFIIPDRREAIRYALGVAKKGDLLVLAGKGHEEYQEIRGVKFPMDERKIVQEILTE